MAEMPHVTILIMDDTGVIRQLVVELLAGLIAVGRILQAADVRAAMPLFVDYHPQIAILAIRVPGDKNGMDGLKYFKTGVPVPVVIMLTNHATARYRHACQQTGADYFFDKSTEFEQVIAVVEALLQQTL